MARSIFRPFHLILEICRSSFLCSPHQVQLDTYTFRKFLVGYSKKLLAVFLVFLFWEGWLSYEVSTFVPIWHCLGSLWVAAELLWSPVLIPGFSSQLG